MPRIQLEFDAAACADPLAMVSTELPAEEFTILSSHPADEGILGLVEIETSDATTVIQHFDDATGLSYEVLHTDEQIVLIQYMIPETESNRALRASRNLPTFPAHLQDGWLSAEHTASFERLSELPAELAAANIPYQIQTIAQTHALSGLLTDRQQECIIEAVKRGYYDSPRRCTLTELADTFNVNKSAASGVIHRAEGRIIKEFVAELTRKSGQDTEPE